MARSDSIVAMQQEASVLADTVAGTEKKGITFKAQPVQSRSSQWWAGGAGFSALAPRQRP